MKNKKIILLIAISLLEKTNASVGPCGEKVTYASENYADDANVVIQGARSSSQPGQQGEVAIQFNNCPNCLPEVEIQALEQAQQATTTEEKVVDEAEKTTSETPKEAEIGQPATEQDAKFLESVTEEPLAQPAEAKKEEQLENKAQELLQDAVESAEKLHEIAQETSKIEEKTVVVEKIVYVYPVYERLQKTMNTVKKTGIELWNFIADNVRRVMKK